MRSPEASASTWIDSKMFPWYAYGSRVAPSPSCSSQPFVNTNGEPRPRKVTFVDSSHVVLDERRSSLQESFDNIKRLFGRMSDWISDSVMDISIKKSFQLLSDKITGRVHADAQQEPKPSVRGEEEEEKEEKETERKEEKKERSSWVNQPKPKGRVLVQNAVPSQFNQSPVEKSDGHAGWLTSHPVSSPNNNIVAGRGRGRDGGSSGSKRNLADSQQGLKEWFIRCMKDYEEVMSRSPGVKSSLERQVALLMTDCFDNFGSLNGRISPNNNTNDNSNNNNRSGSGSDAKDGEGAGTRTSKQRRTSKSPARRRCPVHKDSSGAGAADVPSERGRPAYRRDDPPFLSTLDQPCGKDVSQLIKMFDSYALLESVANKAPLTEKYSNVNVKSIIKQLDLILFQECSNDRRSKLRDKCESTGLWKVEADSAEDELGAVQYKNLRGKEQSDRQANRLGAFRDMVRKAFGFRSAPSIRNRSSTLPPSRVARVMAPVKDQLKNFASRTSWSPEVSGVKVVNSSRNNLDVCARLGSQRIPRAVRVDERQLTVKSDEGVNPSKSHDRAQSRSKSAQPQLPLLPSLRRSRSRGGSKKTEENFNFLFEKIFDDQPRPTADLFPYRSAAEEREKTADGEVQPSETMWEKIYTWELRDQGKTNEDSEPNDQTLDSPPEYAAECNSTKPFRAMPSSAENKNSSSSTVTRSPNAIEEAGPPRREGEDPPIRSTIHRSTWHLDRRNKEMKKTKTPEADGALSSKHKKCPSLKRSSTLGCVTSKQRNPGKDSEATDRKMDEDRKFSPADRGLWQHQGRSAPRPLPLQPEVRTQPVPWPRHNGAQQTRDARRRVKRPPLLVNSGVMLAFDQVIEQFKDRKFSFGEAGLRRERKLPAAMGTPGVAEISSLDDDQMSPRTVMSLIKIFDQVPRQRISRVPKKIHHHHHRQHQQQQQQLGQEALSAGVAAARR